MALLHVCDLLMHIQKKKLDISSVLVKLGGPRGASQSGPYFAL